jgi:thiol:disulfide interchange protein DsbD
MSHFDIFGLPSILFFDKQGNELSQRRVTGFMGADEFSAHVDNTFSL